MATGWKKCKLSKSIIASLVEECLIQSRAIVQWRSAEGEDKPYEGTNEIVLFWSFVERGLAVPTSNFFRGLLHFWGIQLHHLTPNSILHIATFTHLCQAFLGIEPYFNFFHHFFLVRPQPNANKVAEVGSAEVLLCSEKEDKYIFYRPACRGTEWKSAWFYVGNHQPSLPERIPGPHKVCREWSDSGLGGEQVDKLLGDIATLKDSGVTSGSVVYSCMNRRVKPLQK